MSIEIDTVSEAYLALKAYIPVKDRAEAANALLSSLSELLTDDDFEALCEVDSYTKSSASDYLGDTDDYDEDE